MVKIRFIQGIPIVVNIDYEPIQGGTLKFQSDVEDGTIAVLYREGQEQVLCFEKGVADAHDLKLGNYRLVLPDSDPILLNLYQQEGTAKTYARVAIGNDYTVYRWLTKMLVSMDDMIRNQNDRIDSLTGYRTE